MGLHTVLSLASGIGGLVSGESSGGSRQRGEGGPKDLQPVFDSPFVPGEGWPQPLIRRMDDGDAYWVDRIHALGNAVAPAQAAYALQVLDSITKERAA